MKVKEIIKFDDIELKRYDYEDDHSELKNAERVNALHVVYEPGDATRYDFYVIDIEYAYLISTAYGIHYPLKVEKFFLKGTDEEAVKSIAGEYPDSNKYTIWAVVSILKKWSEL